MVLGRDKFYFVIRHSDSEDDISELIDFLIDNIFVMFCGRLFQQTVGIAMGTNCAPLLANSLLYSYEAEFHTETSTDKRESVGLIFWFHVPLSLNNSKFGDYVDRIYLIELGIKDASETESLLT